MPRILIAEDNDAIRTMLRLTLERCGHQCSEAANGREALAIYQPEMFDLVLTDIVMPQMEGLEMIQELKRRNPDIKIIAMSGGGNQGGGGYLKIAEHFGAGTILSKPFSNDELRAAVSLVLSSAE